MALRGGIRYYIAKFGVSIMLACWQEVSAFPNTMSAVETQDPNCLFSRIHGVSNHEANCI